MSRFVFNENTLFIYLFVYLPQRKLDQGSIKGGEAKRRKQSSQQGTTLSQQLTNQGGEGLIRRCFSPGSWTRSPLLLPHECLREAQLQWGNSSGEQPNSSAAHVTCLPGKGSLPFPVKLQPGLGGRRLSSPRKGAPAKTRTPGSFSPCSLGSCFNPSSSSRVKGSLLRWSVQEKPSSEWA